MKTTLGMAILCLLLSGCAAARSKTFWLHTIADAGMAAADAETSFNCRPTCTEINPALGNNPGRARLYATGAAFVALRRLVVAAIWQKNETAGKFFSWFDFIGSTAVHGYLIHNNLRFADLNRHPCPAGYVAVPRPDGIRTCELPGVSIP